MSLFSKRRLFLKKSFFKGLFFPFSIVVLVVILVLDHISPTLFTPTRNIILDRLTPALTFFSSVSSSISTGIRSVEKILIRYQRNTMLEKKATIIPLYKRTIDELKQENRQLRTLLHYNKSLEKAFITARVISNIGGAYAQTLLLNRGALSKVRPGLAVIDERGLLGRIVSVSANSSRVLLLTDSNSSIPAMIQETNQPVILNGDGSNNPILTFLSYRYAPKIGNTIITSGYGGALPPGIPLGKVISITRPFKVKLFAEIPESPYVRIVQFQYTSIKEK